MKRELVVAGFLLLGLGAPLSGCASSSPAPAPARTNPPTRTCPGCGAQVIDPDVKKCPTCDTPLSK